MVNTASVTVKIDDEKIKERMQEFLAQAWDEGHQVHSGCRECWDDGYGNQINPYRSHE